MLSKGFVHSTSGKIGFVWDQLEQDWQENYQLLKQYLEDNGEPTFPKDIQPWKWVGNKEFKKKEIFENAFNFWIKLGLWDPEQAGKEIQGMQYLKMW